MKSDGRLCCDVCFRLYTNTPIFKKPKKIGFRNKTINLKQTNTEGRKEDNICLQCLEREVEEIKKNKIVLYG